MSALTKNTWISISAKYDGIGLVYDVGEIEEVIKTSCNKDGKITGCTVKVFLPFYSNQIGDSFDYSLKLTDWRGKENLPRKDNTWRLCEQSHSMEMGCGTTEQN